MSSPASTGSGESVFSTDRSARVSTVVEVVSESLVESVSSGEVADSDAVLSITVPSGVAASTVSTRVKVSDAPGARIPEELQVMVVPSLEQAPSSATVVFAGMVSVTVKLCESEGPLLVTVNPSATLGSTVTVKLNCSDCPGSRIPDELQTTSAPTAAQSPGSA